MTKRVKIMNNKEKIFSTIEKSSLLTFVITHNKAVLTGIGIIVAVNFWYQETKMNGYINTIEQNNILIASLNKRVNDIYKNSDQIEKDVEMFITKEYGSFSKRDENVAKIKIRLSELDARLENIELLLSKLYVN